MSLIFSPRQTKGNIPSLISSQNILWCAYFENVYEGLTLQKGLRWIWCPRTRPCIVDWGLLVHPARCCSLLSRHLLHYHILFLGCSHSRTCAVLDLVILLSKASQRWCKRVLSFRHAQVLLPAVISALFASGLKPTVYLHHTGIFYLSVVGLYCYSPMLHIHHKL